MSNNNFKLLGKEEEERFPHPPPDTEEGVMGNVRVFQFMSNVLELYIPRVFEMFISLFGGTPEGEDAVPPPTGNSRKDDDDIIYGEPK